jgi:gliding motility-associated-like protein
MRLKNLYLFLILLLPLSGSASHIVGGDFSLQHISGNDYQLTLKVFRDCQNGVPYFNQPLFVGMFERNTNKYITRIQMNILRDDTLRFVGDNCINIPDGCTHIGLYSVKINLDPVVYNSPNGYYFSWERCCRNVIIKNINVGTNPNGNVGMTFYMEIPPLTLKNSTPVFNKNPLTLLCINNPFTFNYEVTDSDGDSLVYSLVDPLKGTLSESNPNDPNQGNYPVINSGPYSPIIWRPGYNLNYIIDGAPTLSINRRTGELNITPTRQGVYVVSILVEEFRKGVKIGEVRRELQFTISTCNTNDPPKITLGTQEKELILTVNATDTIDLEIVATDRNPNDSLYLTFKGDIFGPEGKIQAPYATLKNINGKGRVSTQLRWLTACHHASPDTQVVEIRVVDNGCPLPRTSIAHVKIVVNPPPVVDPPKMFCMDRLTEDKVKLSWGRFDPVKYFSHFVLYRKNPDGSDSVMQTFSSSGQTSFTDPTAYKHRTTDYQYYLKAVNICGMEGNSTYFINTIPNKDSIPVAAYISTATVVENKNVMIYWEESVEPEFYLYRIYRKTNSETDQFNLYTTIDDPSLVYFIDTNVNVQTTSYCYKIIVENQCGYESDESNYGCTVVLTGESFPFEHNVNWSPYSEWDGGVLKYELYRKDPSTDFELVAIVGNNGLYFTDSELNYNEGAYWYRIIAYEGGNSNAVSQSNDIFLIQRPLIHVPNAFTPNSDGINDDWGIQPVFVKDYSIEVFNRWGERIYESRNKLDQWDGIFRKRKPQENVFVYIITFTGWDDSTHHRKGTITLIK